LPWEDFIRLGTFDPAVQRARYHDLMSFSRELHEFMRDHAKLTESEKPLLVSGTLIALRSAAFRKAYDAYKPEELQRVWLREIQEEIDKADIPQAKKTNMTQPYSSIAVHPELGKATKTYPKGVLRELIERLDQKVWPFISVYHDFDVVGQFYGEFLKYTGGDKKALGIVLTPHHVTQLFARLGGVTKASKVLDICAGTGGFLIAAMQQMLAAATTEAERTHIRQQQLVGVEQLPNMFALAASNMILRGDGKANLYQGSCFDEAILAHVKAHQCTVGLINPPFSQGDQDLHELQFVDLMLDCLQPGGTGVAIVPMNRAIASHPARQQLLKHYTLEAVMSMPDELFYPVGTVTCIMVFTAHRPHEETDRKTWFGYWKNDGYVKTKHLGRVDLRHQWPERAARWVEMFRNREVHPGESVMQRVTAQDEWCAEAYMVTDYSKITQADFERTVRNYAVFKLLGLTAEAEAETETTEEEEGANA
jgi:type I restriction-modification system DNA methylase subunit